MKKLFAVVVLCGCLSLLLSLVSCAKPKMPEFQVQVIYQDENYEPAYTYMVEYRSWVYAPFSVMGGSPYAYYTPALLFIYPDNTISSIEGIDTYRSPTFEEWKEMLLTAFPNESFLDTGDNWEIIDSLVFEDEQFLLVYEYSGEFSEQELIYVILFRHTESDGWIYQKYPMEFLKHMSAALNYKYEQYFSRWGDYLTINHIAWFTCDLKKVECPFGEYKFQSRKEFIELMKSDIPELSEFKKDIEERTFCRLLHDSNDGILYDIIIINYPDNSEKAYIVEYTQSGKILRVIFIPYLTVHDTMQRCLCTPGEDGKYYDIIRTVEKESE